MNIKRTKNKIAARLETAAPKSKALVKKFDQSVKSLFIAVGKKASRHDDLGDEVTEIIEYYFKAKGTQSGAIAAVAAAGLMQSFPIVGSKKVPSMNSSAESSAVEWSFKGGVMEVRVFKDSVTVKGYFDNE